MSEPNKHRKLSAILFADIVGYTAIMQADEGKALSFLKHYQDSLGAVVAKHQGEIIKNYGDGSLCLFSSVLEAVTCAKDLQLRLLQEPHVPLRIGIHLGDVNHMDNDVYGDAINIASRIESMGVAGNVLLSKSVYDKIKNQTQLPTESLGKFDFKNIDQSIEVFALQHRGLVVPSRKELKGKFKAPKKSFFQSIPGMASIAGLLLLAIAVFWLVSGKSDHGSAAGISEKIDDKSIAVLAFADMSPEQDQRYFSEGISEEILNLLTRIPKLKVISRTSSFSFKGKEKTTAEIAEILKVKHILDGSIRKSGNTFRISTQLIEAKNGTQLWAETYDRSMDDIFKIQDEIAAKILEQLKVSLMGGALTSQKVDVEAYNLFLKGKQMKAEQSSESDSLAEQMIRASIALDSTYAPAWSLLSELIYNGSFSYSRYSISEGKRLAVDAAKKSIALDPNNIFGYLALTTLNRAENDFESADRNLKKALEIDPVNNTDVIYESSSYALDLGILDEAISQLRKAIRLDPVNYVLYYTLAIHLVWIEEYDAAEKEMQKYLSKNPDSGLANNFMAQIYLKQGKNDAAREALAKDDDPYWSLYRKSILEFAIGDRSKADQYLKEFIDLFGHEGWPNIAHIYAYRGEADQAFKWLNLAVDNEDASTLEILNYPEFKFMRKDARWGKLIERLKLPARNGFK